MKSVLISDNRDTLVGMRLAGIDGYLLKERDEILEAVKKEMNDPDVGILFLTEKAADLIRDDLIELRKKTLFPLITVIPDRHGFQSDNGITKYITQAIGV